MLAECLHKTNRATRVVAKLDPAGQPWQKAVAKQNGHDAFLQKLTHNYAVHHGLPQDYRASCRPPL